MKYQFGEKIRHVREKRRMTLREVAERAGVSESLVSQIERNKVSPAIDTLMEIVRVLDLDLEYLFADFRREGHIHLVRRSERPRIMLQDVVYEQLSRTSEREEKHGIAAYYLEIKPGARRGSEEYGHVGKELGIILQGSGEFRIGNAVHHLEAGDSLSFDSALPHVLSNTGEDTLCAHWVMTPPKLILPES